MIARLKEYIRSQQLFAVGQRVLLAVSGGIDSSVLAQLFHTAGFSYGIAHCNFQLRGKESDEDEKFVETMAGIYGVPFFCKRFDTLSYASKSGISTQMAARDLRYAWFTELLENENYRCIATAHHLDDQIETFFINMLRGSGISGLHGILSKQGTVIRPLLFAWRNDIEKHALKNQVPYREDQSNKESHYLRNKIRNKLLPLVKEICPEYRSILTTNIKQLRDAEIIYNAAIAAASGIIIKKEDQFVIPVKQLLLLEPLRTYLFELLKPYNFSTSVVDDILKNIERGSGKKFFSPTHRLISDREQLIITRLQIDELESVVFEIPEGAASIEHPLRLSMQRVWTGKNYQVQREKNIATLDKNKLIFPLVIRKWKTGDTFYPFGMKGKKKVSDYFTDHKFSLADKENVWLLCSGKDIVWIIGHRMDDRFKITTETKTGLKIKVEHSE
ncbi:MAG: tRNA lysidine(34) synthetase TilS [Bacteroidota bacterium]